MSSRQICIVKVGSAVIANRQGGVDKQFLTDLCRQLDAARARGWQPILVSSGAKMTGLAILPHAAFNDARRAFCAIGQSELISSYARILKEAGSSLVPAQILLSRATLADRDRYDTIRDTLIQLLDQGVLPILNNNDPTNSEIFDFQDNDQLAAFLAGMVHADRVVLVSDVGGVFDSNPKESPGAARIPALSEDETLWREQIKVSDKNTSFGGMAGKLDAMRLLNALGVDAHIVPARGDDWILRSLAEPASDFGTRLNPRRGRVRGARKTWISAGAHSRGVLVISDAGAGAMKKWAVDGGAFSVLALGVIRHHGSFGQDDPVTIRDDEYNLVGVGLSRFSAEQLSSVIAERPSTIVVHNDDMIPARNAPYADRDDGDWIRASAGRIRRKGYRIVENRSGDRDTRAGAIIRIENHRVRQSEEARAGVEADDRQNRAESAIVLRDQAAFEVWRDATRMAKGTKIAPEDWILFRAVEELSAN